MGQKAANIHVSFRKSEYFWRLLKEITGKLPLLRQCWKIKELKPELEFSNSIFALHPVFPWIFAPVSMNGYTYPHIFLVKYEEISGA